MNTSYKSYSILPQKKRFVKKKIKFADICRKIRRFLH